MIDSGVARNFERQNGGLACQIPYRNPTHALHKKIFSPDLLFANLVGGMGVGWGAVAPICPPHRGDANDY